VDTPTAIALILASVAVIVAYLGWQRAGAQARQLEGTRLELAKLRKELGDSRTSLEAGLQQMRHPARREAGKPVFTPEMTISEALATHPGVKLVLASFNLAGCPDCAVSDVDTLEGACRSYGLDQDTLMKALAALVERA
jgi:hybrid cluster-associated redox disulfide protein